MQTEAVKRDQKQQQQATAENERADQLAIPELVVLLVQHDALLDVRSVRHFIVYLECIIPLGKGFIDDAVDFVDCGAHGRGHPHCEGVGGGVDPLHLFAPGFAHEHIQKPASPHGHKPSRPIQQLKRILKIQFSLEPTRRSHCLRIQLIPAPTLRNFHLPIRHIGLTPTRLVHGNGVASQLLMAARVDIVLRVRYEVLNLIVDVYGGRQVGVDREGDVAGLWGA
jgi:hypothetical protein